MRKTRTKRPSSSSFLRSSATEEEEEEEEEEGEEKGGTHEGNPSFEERKGAATTLKEA